MYLLRNALDVVNVWLVFVPGVIVLTDCQSQQPAKGRVACIGTLDTQYKTGAVHALFNYTHKYMSFAIGPVKLLDTSHFTINYQF